MAENKSDTYSGSRRTPPECVDLMIAFLNAQAATYGFRVSPAQVKNYLELWVDLEFDAPSVIASPAERVALRAALERESRTFAPQVLHYLSSLVLRGLAVTRDMLEGIPWERVRQCPKCDQLYWASRVEAVEDGACPKCADAYSKQKSRDKKKRELESQLTEYHECIEATGGDWPQFSREFKAATAARRDKLLRDARKAKHYKEELGWELRR